MENTDILKNFGLHLKYVRMKKGLSQAKLAELLNIHLNNVGEIERGKRNIKLKTIETLAKALDVDIAELFDFKD